MDKLLIGLQCTNEDSLYGKWFEKYFNADVKRVDRYDDSIDLLVMVGGADVDTIRYGQTNQYSQQPDMKLEEFDMVHLDNYIYNKIPVFGICRGHQSLAVHHGMSLIQDMEIPHYEVNFIHHIKGFDYVSCDHHQCVDSLSLIDSCEIMATAPDGTIEALYYPETNCASVQFHPEWGEECQLTSYLINKLIYNVKTRNDKRISVSESQ